MMKINAKTDTNRSTWGLDTSGRGLRTRYLATVVILHSPPSRSDNARRNMMAPATCTYMLRITFLTQFERACFLLRTDWLTSDFARYPRRLCSEAREWWLTFTSPSLGALATRKFLGRNAGLWLSPNKWCSNGKRSSCARAYLVWNGACLCVCVCGCMRDREGSFWE